MINGISMSRAAAHPIVCLKPAVRFFEGAVLGNGGMGAVVTTRPDSVVIHIGHNNIWDIRVAEDNKEKIGVFQEIFERVKAIPDSYASLDDDPWLREYLKMTADNYSNKLYPRPFPCGSLILGFDRRHVELIGHTLHIENGVCEVHLLVENKPATLRILIEMDADRLWLDLVNADGQPLPSPFDRVRLLPDPERTPPIPFAPANDSSNPATLPSAEALYGTATNCIAFRQVLPAQDPAHYSATVSHPKDRAYRMAVAVNGVLQTGTRVNWHDQVEALDPFERFIDSPAAFVAMLQLDEGLATQIAPVIPTLPAITPDQVASAREATRHTWENYWSKSGVRIDDPLLEETWYWNLYFLNCAAKAGINCPGLYANWSYRGIGSAWHGDYHLNYNIQQPFWVTFSSNHVEKHLPYVELVDHMLPISQQWAKEYYQLRGAFFPHSAYPTEMTIMPYPVPTWGWEICETPWAVQSLWWHYLYTMDIEFLRQRAFGPIREAVLFLVDYMMRPEAHGADWNDDRYHVYPTVPPELYGLQPGFHKNYDCLVDLTLIKFVFNAYLKACDVLKVNQPETELIGSVREILAHFPDYPTAAVAQSKVFVSVPDEDPQVVYNVPNSLVTVFPGEEHGLHSDPATRQILADTLRNTRNEGGNELVFMNLQAARIGLLDLERFKRQILYCRLPNGSCTDMVLQVHGRYSDTTDYAFMADLGVWVENFALPVVINECMLQSYTGVLNLFPNWPADKTAEFYSLRAVGAFLVSAAIANGRVQWIEITSEAGSPLKVNLPWAKGARLSRHSGETIVSERLLETETAQGEVLRLTENH